MSATNARWQRNGTTMFSPDRCLNHDNKFITAGARNQGLQEPASIQNELFHSNIMSQCYTYYAMSKSVLHYVACSTTPANNNEYFGESEGPLYAGICGSQTISTTEENGERRARGGGVVEKRLQKNTPLNTVTALFHAHARMLSVHAPAKQSSRRARCAGTRAMRCAINPRALRVDRTNANQTHHARRIRKKRTEIATRRLNKYHTEKS